MSDSVERRFVIEWNCVEQNNKFLIKSRVKCIPVAVDKFSECYFLYKLLRIHQSVPFSEILNCVGYSRFFVDKINFENSQRFINKRSTDYRECTERTLYYAVKFDEIMHSSIRIE